MGPTSGFSAPATHALTPALTLIAITDDLRDGISGLTARAVAAVRGGATMVQLRLKQADARTVIAAAEALCNALPANIPLIINDRVDVALVAGAAGVHVGADDMPVAAARRITPPGFLIGASVGSDDEIANSAQADYVGIGPLYATSSKPDAGDAIGIAGFSRLAARVACPAVAIGGITAASASEVAKTSAAGIAIISAIMGAPDPEAAARHLFTTFARAHRP